ncbi:unnamed protein product, partial [Hapterophycus canaliculatus]
QVEVTRDFELLDRPVGLVLATLGLPMETLVKVRRRRILAEDAGGNSRSPSSTDISGGDGGPAVSIAASAAIGGIVRNREGFDEVHDVSPDALVRAGDVLVLSCDRNAMVCAQVSLLNGRKEGLRVLGVSTLGLPRPGSAFFELVLSRTSQFLGRTACLENDAFAARYGCSVVAFRLKGSTGGGVDLIGSTRTSRD